MKEIFVYLKGKQYIEAFKSVQPTVNDMMLGIYKIFFIILKNDKMINLYETSIDKFWKKMTDDFVRKSFDGENLSKYMHQILLEGLDFNIEHILKINYIWKSDFNEKYDIKDITKESPTTGIFLLIIKEYLEWCGIIESYKNDPFYSCFILKSDILKIDERILELANFYNKINK